MTLQEVVDEYDNLSEKRKVYACKEFLREISESNISYLTETIYNWMIEVVDLEQDDFFGTEGMNI